MGPNVAKQLLKTLNDTMPPLGWRPCLAVSLQCNRSKARFPLPTGSVRNICCWIVCLKHVATPYPCHMKIASHCLFYMLFFFIIVSRPCSPQFSHRSCESKFSQPCKLPSINPMNQNMLAAVQNMDPMNRIFHRTRITGWLDLGHQVQTPLWFIAQPSVNRRKNATKAQFDNLYAWLAAWARVGVGICIKSEMSYTACI